FTAAARRQLRTLSLHDALPIFDPDRFAEVAAHEQIKMIEIKLSQGAKPGHGGILPAAKITPEIARTRGVLMDVDCVSPSSHSTRSEEHTSELQSRENLVCRLLL